MTRFKNGDPIPFIPQGINWVAASSAAYCVNEFNNGVSFADTQHGMHYNWFAASDSRGLCPEGYHVPTGEFGQLIIDLGFNQVAGNKMKLISTDSYLSWGGENNGDNSSGFSAVPSGYRDDVSGLFLEELEKGYFWTANEGTTGKGVVVRLSSNTAVVASLDDYKTSGFSCRCVGDQ